MKTLYLVSCVSQKKAGKHRAEELYDSDWFKKARSYVKATGCQWFILSAQYGLLEPRQEIASYNKTLNSMKATERKAWAGEVLSKLRKILKNQDQVVMFAGLKYREYLVDEIEKLGIRVEVPLKGLGIGQQKSWLKREAASHE